MTSYIWHSAVEQCIPGTDSVLSSACAQCENVTVSVQSACGCVVTRVEADVEMQQSLKKKQRNAVAAGTNTMLPKH